MIDSNKIYECNAETGSFYRSYNENMPFEWNCIAYEANKLVNKIKKSLSDAK